MRRGQRRVGLIKHTASDVGDGVVSRVVAYVYLAWQLRANFSTYISAI
jgi:hypothetical protein